MKLSNTTLTYVRNVVSTADAVKIDSIIIEPGRVRAIDENHTVFILQTTNVPDMEFGSIGLNRINTFTSRFDLGKSFSDFTVEATVEGADVATSFARSLTMKAKGVKVEYRCANPTIIKAPKGLADTIAYKANLNPEIVSMMQKGQSAMSADDITFIGTDEGLFFQMSDINADQLNYQCTNEVFRESAEEDEEDTPIEFTHSYPIKTLLPLFKLNNTGSVYFTKQEGIMKITVNGLDVYVLPRT